MTTPTCPSCHGDSPDRLLCQRCADTLVGQLRELPEWLGFLDDAMARVIQSGTGNGNSRSAETPLPYDEAASKTRTYVRNQLATWAAELNSGDRQIADNPRAWCLYLARNIGVIRAHPAAPEIAQEIHYCTRLVRKAVDIPAARVYLGTCDADAEDRAICGTPLYARAGEAAIVCPGCSMGYDVEARRAEMLARVEHQWGTIGTCAHVLAIFDIQVKSETVRSWTRPRQSGRGMLPARLAARGRDQGGSQLYRVGDVMDLALEMRKAAEAKRPRRAAS